MRLLLIYFTACIMASSFLPACGNNENDAKKKEIQQTPSTSTPDSVSIKASTNKPDIINAHALLDKIFNNGMPILLSKAKAILGDKFIYKKAEGEGSFDFYTWNVTDGSELNFEDINYNENGVELDALTISTKTKNIIECPFGLVLNQSTFTNCKSLFPALTKANGDEKDYKFLKDKIWYYLKFDKDNILKEIRCAGWEIDTTG